MPLRQAPLYAQKARGDMHVEVSCSSGNGVLVSFMQNDRFFPPGSQQVAEMAWGRAQRGELSASPSVNHELRSIIIGYTSTLAVV